MDYENNKSYNELIQQLDRGIDDMEAGRELPLDEAFDLISQLVEKDKTVAYLTDTLVGILKNDTNLDKEKMESLGRKY